MQLLPAQDLRSNVGTWAVPPRLAPAVAKAMFVALAPEPFDPALLGQEPRTTYFDTPRFALRGARHRGGRYLTLRVRRYGDSVFALSAKTEGQKFRVALGADDADALLAGHGETFARLLPADLLARLLALADGAPLLPVVTVGCRRYAVEDEVDRLTLDAAVETDTGKALGFVVLELKSTDAAATPPAVVAALALRPIKLSKFLWSTLWR